MFNRAAVLIQMLAILISGPCFGADLPASGVEHTKVVFSQDQGFQLLALYVVVIAALPVIGTLYDIWINYRERRYVLGKLPEKTTAAEIEQLLKVMDAAGPSGFTGLTRGIVAVTLLMILVVPVLHFGVAGSDIPKTVNDMLMLLAGSLTSITGFYFGSKAASEAASKLERKNAKGPTPPLIQHVDPDPARAGAAVTLTGEGFGGEKGHVIFGKGKEGMVQPNGWSDTRIEVEVPASLSGMVSVVVRTKRGISSEAYQLTVS